jgi:hypothetical protein
VFFGAQNCNMEGFDVARSVGSNIVLKAGAATNRFIGFEFEHPGRYYVECFNDGLTEHSTAPFTWSNHDNSFQHGIMEFPGNDKTGDTREDYALGGILLGSGTMRVRDTQIIVGGASQPAATQAPAIYLHHDSVTVSPDVSFIELDEATQIISNTATTMSLTFTDMETELAARGFTISTARAGVLVNRAYQRLVGLHRWPFREASGEGTAPSTSRTSGRSRRSRTRRSSTRSSLSPTTTCWAGTGTSRPPAPPLYAYRAYVDSIPVVATYPTNTDTIGVQYWKIPTDLSGVQVPIVPARYQLLIVEIASVMAERERGNHDAANALQVEVDRQVAEMVDELLPQQEPAFQSISFASEDW